tara:strand:+ start:869 stop:1909 length:1041 start_codon:yes stop_codon:yes gene_type:complete
MGSSSSKQESDVNSPKKVIRNVYNEEIQTCESRYGNNYSQGSMQEDGTCTEPDGGVHQICLEDIGIGKGFSESTGQSDWSTEKGDKSHCVCLGAYANFVARQKLNDKSINCSATPNTVFDPKYVRKWSNWNDVTVPDQISAGVKDLYKQCLDQAGNEDNPNAKTRRKNLTDNYSKLHGYIRDKEDYRPNDACEPKLVPCGENGSRVYTKHNSCTMADPVDVLKKILDNYNSDNKLMVWRLLSPSVRKTYKNDFDLFDLLSFKKIVFYSGLEWKLTYQGIMTCDACKCILLVRQKDDWFEFKMKRQYKADPLTEKNRLGSNFLYKRDLMWWRLDDIKKCKLKGCSRR